MRTVTRNIVVVVFLTLFASVVFAQSTPKTAPIRIAGATVFDSKVLIALFAGSDARPGTARWLSPAHEAYYAVGYLDATFTMTLETPDSTWFVFVDEGAAARVGRVRVHGIDNGAEVRSKLGLDQGSPFDTDGDPVFSR